MGNVDVIKIRGKGKKDEDAVYTRDADSFNLTYVKRISKFTYSLFPGIYINRLFYGPFHYY